MKKLCIRAGCTHLVDTGSTPDGAPFCPEHEAELRRKCTFCRGVLVDDVQMACDSPGNPTGYCHDAVGRAEEKVDHPAHYGGADNPYEAIKVIEAWELDFCLGNAVKYICRAGKKGSELEDLKKAVWYLQRRIAIVQER